MVERTSTGNAPWTLVEANDKNYARVKILQTLCERVEAELDGRIPKGIQPLSKKARKVAKSEFPTAETEEDGDSKAKSKSKSKSKRSIQGKSRTEARLIGASWHIEYQVARCRAMSDAAGLPDQLTECRPKPAAGRATACGWGGNFRQMRQHVLSTCA
jgi:hypothetical protein